MAIGDILTRIRREQNLTQEDMARKLYVTRQAISRWETGETAPGIDMCKLIAVSFNMPVAQLLEMPEGDFCQSCGMPFYGKGENYGTKADGTPSEDFCSLCYREGTFIDDESLDDFIEHAAPLMAEACHISPDEAISFLGATLPHLKRWE